LKNFGEKYRCLDKTKLQMKKKIQGKVGAHKSWKFKGGGNQGRVMDQNGAQGKRASSTIKEKRFLGDKRKIEKIHER